MKSVHFFQSLIARRIAGMPGHVNLIPLNDVVESPFKPSRRIADIQAKYVGREIPDEFVVGYGMDYDERFRNLPYIGILKREVYGG